MMTLRILSITREMMEVANAVSIIQATSIKRVRREDERHGAL